MSSMPRGLLADVSAQVGRNMFPGDDARLQAPDRFITA
jgi:hypothetical protein